MLPGRGKFVDVFGAALEARAFLCDAALAAGHELGVFEALAHKGRASLDQLAGELGVVTESHRLRALLEVLAALGAVARDRCDAGVAAEAPPRFAPVATVPAYPA